MRVDIRLLGGFDMVVDGRRVPPREWRRRAAAGLVKLLALQPGRRLGREQVIDALWPDLLLEEAAPRLHTAAHYARTAAGVADAVVLAAGTVSLFPDAEVTIDAFEFDRVASTVPATADPATAGEAADRYTGVLLPDDLYEAWTEEPRDRLRLLHLDLLRSAGRYQDLVAEDPLDEGAQLALVRDHVQAGRRRAALRALDQMAELFRRELGTEPGPEAVALRAGAESLPVEPVAAPPPGGPVPPAHPPDRAPAPLPAPRGRLIGRGADLEAVAALLRENRLVTITGPGGAGKSTLALALARELQTGRLSGPTDDGGAPASGPLSAEVFLTELAPVRAGADVTRAVAEAGGVQGEGAVDTARLAANLGPRDVLLVLDNCEHLLDASATLVDAVLDAGPSARVLVTSREPLRVDGEVVHRIGSLGRDSAELFVERAVAAAGPGAASVDDPRVVELCERLDGLPLAIELAAAQLRHLALPDLIDRLDDRLTLLVGGRPKAGQRHSALTATIEWSHRLLSDEAREVFDVLGVFPASFDLAAVQVVCAETDPTTVTNLLGDLVAKNLVVHDPGTRRYRLLETIRLFAVRRLEQSSRRAEMVERLRRHVVARACSTSRVRMWLSASMAAQSRDDLDNVRLAFDASLECGDTTAAVDVALGLSTLWRNAVSYAEGSRWVVALRSRELSSTDRFWTSLLAADVGLGSGDPRMMRTASAEALALSTTLDDEGGRIVATIYDAMAQLIDPVRAAERLQVAAEQARRADEPGLERLARGFRLVPLRLLGRMSGLEEEVADLTRPRPALDYDRYICIWAASLLALVDRDGTRLGGLMAVQLSDLKESGLQENWLTIYWGALSLISRGEDHLAQLRQARRRAEAEGRQADADCVLAVGYAAACADDWERAAALLGAASETLQRDTAGFIHHALLCEQLVRPRLEPAVFAAATARGHGLSLEGVLREHGL